MDSFSQLENELRSERQIEGIRRAKKKGVYEMRDCLSVSQFLYPKLINNSLVFSLITGVIFINTNLRKKRCVMELVVFQ